MINLEITGQDKLLARLREVGDSTIRRNILEDIGSYAVSSTQNRFIEEQDPDGKDWNASYRSENEGGQILRDSNILFQSLTYDASSNHVSWGSNIIYAAIHQFGGDILPKNGGKLKFKIGGHFITANKVTIPARPYMGVNDADEAEFMNIIEDHVGEILQ